MNDGEAFDGASPDDEFTADPTPVKRSSSASDYDDKQHLSAFHSADIRRLSSPPADIDSELILPRQSEVRGAEDTVQELCTRRKGVEEEDREKMQVLVSHFTEEQLDRYEMYRRSAFPKAAIKRVMQTLTTCSVSQNAVIAMSGITKVFVGEIMEEALDVKESWQDSGPVQPKHLREALRRLRRQNQPQSGAAECNSAAPVARHALRTLHL